MLDQPDNISNCIGCLEFDTYDEQKMRTYLLDKVGLIHRCRSKLVKIMGLWWFKTMEDEEWNNTKNKMFQTKQGIHDMA